METDTISQREMLQQIHKYTTQPGAHCNARARARMDSWQCHSSLTITNSWATRNTRVRNETGNWKLKPRRHASCRFLQQRRLATNIFIQAQVCGSVNQIPSALSFWNLWCGLRGRLRVRSYNHWKLCDMKRLQTNRRFSHRQHSCVVLHWKNLHSQSWTIIMNSQNWRLNGRNML